MEIEIGEQTYAGINRLTVFRCGSGAGRRQCEGWRGVHMVGTIIWIIAVLIGVIGLTIAFIINARTLTRDVHRRRDTFRAHLENEANAMIDNLLDIDRRRGERPPS